MAHWVSVWGQAHAIIDLAGTRYRDRTALVTVRTDLGGEQVRLRLSNREGKKPLRVVGATVQTPDSGAVRLLFGGEAQICLEPGGEKYSDAVSLPVRPGDYLCIRMAFCGAPNSGNSIGTGVIYSAKGDFTAAEQFDAVLPGRGYRLPGMEEAVPILAAVETLAEDDAGALVCFGDSITQMNLWTGPLSDMLLRQATGRLSVINKGIGGNRLLHGPATFSWSHFGRAGVERFERDVLEESGAKAVIFAIGTNDIGHVHDPKEKEWTGADRLAKALAGLTGRAREKGMTVIGTTLLPCMGCSGYLPVQNAEREKLNDWVRGAAGTVFDAVIDFDEVVRDAHHPAQLNMAYDSGDHLHPGRLGGLRMAERAMDVCREALHI